MEPFAPLWGGRLDKPPYYVTKTPHGELVSTFGPGAPVLAAPFYVLDRLREGPHGTYARVLKVGRVAAGVACAVALTFFYLAAVRIAPALEAALSSIALGFGSAVFTIASRGLWQHTFALPLLAGAMLLLLRAAESRKSVHACLAGLLLGLAVMVRPQMAVFLAASFVAALFAGVRFALWIAIGALPPIGFILGYNSWYFDSPFTFAQTLRSVDVALYKTGSPSLLSSNPMEALAGLLISPSRGLIVFSPVLALGAMGVASWLLGRVAPGPKRRHFLVGLATGALLLLLTQVFWFDWWGGYTVSYRPIVETTPVLALGLAYWLARPSFRKLKYALVLPLVLWSLLVSLLTVTHPGVVMWNEERDVDHHPERLFELRGSLIQRILEARPEDERAPLDAFPARVRIP